MEFCRFNGIHKDELTTIIPYLHIANYQTGDYIFKTNDNPNNFYCILRGKISILTPEIKMKKLLKDKQNKTFNEFHSINSYYVTNPLNDQDEKQEQIKEIKKIPKCNGKICKFNF